MAEFTESIEQLIERFAQLPGIGRKSAERLAYHILRVPKPEALALAEAISAVKENVQHCQQCFNLSEGPRCRICQDSSRDQTKLCVVEQPHDLMALEQAAVYKGLYHVLLGRLAPLDGIGPEQITIDPLLERVRTGHFNEIIMATNPNTEGDGTALFLSNLLAEMPVQITRLARGVTAGSMLEFTNKEILADALSGRQKF